LPIAAYAAAIALAICLVAGTIGYLVGLNRSNITLRTCPAYVAPTEATASCGDGWSYGIPVNDIEWHDTTGGIHSGGRPSCLPVGPQQVDRLTFATVDADLNGRHWRPVVWVSC
jgi:hypothetical protein